MPTLLMADESVTVQRVIALTFAEEPSFQVVAVSDGRQAIERIAAQPPDIVLAGTTLPHVNGYDLAKVIRNRPGMQQTPVLLLMGAFESVDDAQLQGSGANGILEKPVEPQVVISRVKELLGLKTDARPASQTGRLITSADGPGERRLPVATPPRAVTSTRPSPAAARPAPSSWDELRQESGLGPDARSVEDSATRSDYVDSLDAAFDTLDMQLSGRAAPAKQRNPAGPLGARQSAGDPRSPGAAPSPESGSSNSVFEVDESWFGDAGSPAPAVQHDIRDDLRDPQLVGESVRAVDPVFELDDQWFGEEKARAAKSVGQDSLVAEMGIHDVDLPPVEPKKAIEVPGDLRITSQDLDLLEPPAPAVPETPAAAPVSSVPAAAPRATVPTPPTVSQVAAPPSPVSQPVPMPMPVPVPMPAHQAVADDFAALLAFEQGETPAPSLETSQAVRVVAPEITPGMLDEIAARVADRLSAATFGDRLRDSMAAAVRETVRAVVSETSERLVRDEIERIKNTKP